MRKGRFLGLCVASTILFTLPGYGAIYKCVDDSGKVIFQDQTCGRSQQTKPVRFGANVTNVMGNEAGANGTNSAVSSDNIVGVWGSDDRHLNMMADGTMLIDVHRGEMLTGRWFKVGQQYRVSMTRNHKPIALTLNYRPEVDGLYLNSFRDNERMVRFWRADELTIDAQHRYQQPAE